MHAARPSGAAAALDVALVSLARAASLTVVGDLRWARAR
jgi:hypothetical protein